jgi:transglycosylase-like protein with SLT domain
MSRPVALACVALLALLPVAAPARTLYSCLRDDRLSLATAPEPGSRCVAKQAHAGRIKNFWGSLGPVRGNIYARRIGGRMVYSTRPMPGWSEVDRVVALKAPADSQAHYGMGQVGSPRLDAFAAQFRAAAKRNGVEDAWLRAIAHAESGFDPRAMSPKGAQGVMQLMPSVARAYGVADPFSSAQSIDGGARHIKALMRRYHGDLTLVAAAYNAGSGAVQRFGGVPPYSETQAYVEKVQALYARYRVALGRPRVGS